MSRFARLTAMALLAIATLAPGAAGARFITLASTTSTENAGLFDHILPLFTGETGIAVRVIAVGTGQALRLGINGDVDVVLVHHRPSEDRFIADGHGALRRDVMSNDFVIVGPAADPLGLADAADAAAAFRVIAADGATFASRGDDSGTHKAETAVWAAAGLDPAGEAWYREMGAGMGATLNAAAAMDAHTLADRATWLAFANRGGLGLVFEGDPALFNPYGVMLVNPDRHPHVKAADGRRFIDWLTGPAGQAAIAAFRIGGTQVFFPRAGTPK